MSTGCRCLRDARSGSSYRLRLSLYLDLALLPRYVADLVDRSVHFYARIERLDRAWRKGFELQPAAVQGDSGWVYHSTSLGCLKPHHFPRRMAIMPVKTTRRAGRGHILARCTPR